MSKLIMATLTLISAMPIVALAGEKADHLIEEDTSASYDTWFEGRGGNTQNLTLSDGKKARDTTVIGDDENYLNRLHHTITIPFPSSPDLKLYIDPQTHLISKMVRAYLSIPLWVLLPRAVIPDCRQDLSI
jgi:hypothetical protein